MMYSTILFDLDGTILDSADMIADSLSFAIEKHLSVIPSREELINGIGTPLVEQLTYHAAQLGHHDPQLVNQLVETYISDNLSRHDSSIALFEGADETLKALFSRGLTLGIVTSKPVETATRGLNLFGLTGLFSVIVGCDSVQHHKPHPAPVLYALKALEADASSTIFIGDSTHDIHSGNRAGVDTMAVLWGPYQEEALREAKPSFVTETFEELLRICTQPS